jgi:hypothetical protein
MAVKTWLKSVVGVVLEHFFRRALALGARLRGSAGGCWVASAKGACCHAGGTVQTDSRPGAALDLLLCERRGSATVNLDA